MKKVILRKLTLQNWRKQNSEILFNEDITKVYGQNKAGKSSLRHAFLWLITGYDGDNRMNYNLFDNTKTYTAEDSPAAVVEAVIEANGYEYILKKTAEVGWIRRRGSNTYERKGTDDYKFFIDGIELSAGKYKEKIAELFCDFDVLRSVIDINYFLSLDWKEQRKALAVMAGDIEDSDLKGNYDELLPKLSKYSLAELKSSISSDIKPLRDSLKSLPITIKALENNLPDIKEAEEAKKLIENYKEQINNIDKELQGFSDSIKPLIEKRNKELQEISDLERAIKKDKETYEEKQLEKTKSISAEIDSVYKENAEIDKINNNNESNKKDILERINVLEKDLNFYREKRNNLLDKLDEISEEEFTEDKCSYCGQLLPEDKLESLKKSFYENVENSKKAIIKEGLSVKEYIERINKSIENLKAQLKEIPTVLREKKDLSVLQTKLAESQKDIVPFEQTELYKSAMEALEEKRKSVTVIPEQDNSGLISMKEHLLKQIEAESEKVGLVKERKKQEDKIEEFRQQQKDTANALAEKEKLDAQIKAYEEERAKIISRRVNKYFKRCNITMMSQDKSGVWIPDCVITGIDGAIAATSNGAERILIGIDVANAFAEFFDISIPLFVDDMNLVDSSNEIKTYHQLIELIVNDNDNELRVE